MNLHTKNSDAYLTKKQINIEHGHITDRRTLTQGGSGHWAVYYTSPQCFRILFLTLETFIKF